MFRVCKEKKVNLMQTFFYLSLNIDSMFYLSVGMESKIYTAPPVINYQRFNQLSNVMCQGYVR